MRPLGVGLVYWSELDPLFQPGVGLVSVLELEPETLWEKTASAGSPLRYQVNRVALDRIASLPQRKLVHGVGHPVGGGAEDPIDYVPAFAEAIGALQPAWASEHLSFNRVKADGLVEDCGFLLPPRQTPAGVRRAVRKITEAASRLPVPFAFETGVNYLQPRADELCDGDFFGSIARQASCGIVLDLHNLWANERNGRQPMAEVLDRIPLDQVWEVHLAGGMEQDGYWLDAHSGAIPPELLDRAASILPRLPNVGALIFEILPSHVPTLGLDGVIRQIESLKNLWLLRPPEDISITRVPSPGLPSGSADELIDSQVWESSVAAAALGRTIPPGLFTDLDLDPGTKILRQLVTEFRRSHVARAMRYTLTLLLVTRGHAAVRRLMDHYCRDRSPDLFTAVECDRFAHFLWERDAEASQDSPLAQVLAFEHALIRASLYGEPTELKWRLDPVELLDALDRGHPPLLVPCAEFTMTIQR